jgi:hypothetical protein
MPISGKPRTKESQKHYVEIPRPDTQVLLERLLNYESKRVLSEPRPMSASEREMLRAELVRDFVCFAEMAIQGKTPAKSKAISVFVRKLAELAIPSHELLGTYLAAINVLYERHPDQAARTLNDAARNTIIYLLDGCAAYLARSSAKKPGITERKAAVARVAA